MDSIVYDALSRYYHTLEVKGYLSDINVNKLLILCFYKDFIFDDYRGLISKDDYVKIEKALYCLFGTTCLIPYPDYLKMNKAYLGQVSELSRRIKALEEAPVLKLMHDISSIDQDPDSDIMVVRSED